MQNGEHITEIEHTEFIGNVSGSNSFANASYPINPGLAETFPWLSGLAQNFSEYHFEELNFQYRTTSSVIGTGANPGLGMVYLATNYNATQPAFTTSSDMANYIHCTTAIASKGVSHTVDSRNGHNPLNKYYVRTGTQDSGDLRLVDVGNFQLATEGMPSVYTCGQLWVTYRVRFTKPAPVSGYVGSIFVGSTQSATAAAGFGSIPLTELYNSLTFSTRPKVKLFYSTGTSTVWMPSVGYYRLTFQWSGSTAPITVEAEFLVNDAAYLQFGSLSESTLVTGSTTRAVAILYVKVIKSGTYVAGIPNSENALIMNSGLTGMANAELTVLAEEVPSTTCSTWSDSSVPI